MPRLAQACSTTNHTPRRAGGRRLVAAGCQDGHLHVANTAIEVAAPVTSAPAQASAPATAVAAAHPAPARSERRHRRRRRRHKHSDAPPATSALGPAVVRADGVIAPRFAGAPSTRDAQAADAGVDVSGSDDEREFVYPLERRQGVDMFGFPVKAAPDVGGGGATPTAVGTTPPGFVPWRSVTGPVVAVCLYGTQTECAMLQDGDGSGGGDAVAAGSGGGTGAGAGAGTGGGAGDGAGVADGERWLGHLPGEDPPTSGAAIAATNRDTEDPAALLGASASALSARGGDLMPAAMSDLEQRAVSALLDSDARESVLTMYDPSRHRVMLAVAGAVGFAAVFPSVGTKVCVTGAPECRCLVRATLTHARVVCAPGGCGAHSASPLRGPRLRAVPDHR